MKSEISKLCPLCNENDIFKLPLIDVHAAFGFHQTDALYWQPAQGHNMKEAHDKLIKLFKAIENMDMKIESLTKIKGEYEWYVSLPWYKRILSNEKRKDASLVQEESR